MNPNIWSPNKKFSPGMTSFHFYDNDLQFQIDADRVSMFVASRLGYPIVDVELSNENIYSAFEQAVTIYGNEVYAYKLRDNYITIEGAPTDRYFNNTIITPNLLNIVKLSEQYGVEAGVGGHIPRFSASVSVSCGIQDYDINKWAESNGISGKTLRITRVFWYAPPVYGGPYDINGVVGATTSGATLFNSPSEFGSLYGDNNFFMLMPLNFDLANIQEIEMAREIRRPNYSFEIVNNNIRIFPIPTYDTKLWFEYMLDADIHSSSFDNTCISGSDGKMYPRVSNVLNAPFTNPIYAEINSIGRQWIFEYTLALCMETLGLIRGKYSSVPIPGDTVTLNGGDLLSRGGEIKNALIERLRTYLDENSRKSQLERKSQEMEFVNSQNKNIPFLIYIG